VGHREVTECEVGYQRQNLPEQVREITDSELHTWLESNREGNSTHSTYTWYIDTSHMLYAKKHTQNTITKHYR
jgi:cation transport regulator ChaC